TAAPDSATIRTAASAALLACRIDFLPCYSVWRGRTGVRLGNVTRRLEAENDRTFHQLAIERNGEPALFARAPRLVGTVALCRRRSGPTRFCFRPLRARGCGRGRRFGDGIERGLSFDIS